MKDRISEFWRVPATTLNLDDLQHKLKGPLDLYDVKPPYGRDFLVERAKKPVSQDRFAAGAICI